MVKKFVNTVFPKKHQGEPVFWHIQLGKLLEAFKLLCIKGETIQGGGGILFHGGSLKGNTAFSFGVSKLVVGSDEQDKLMSYSIKVLDPLFTEQQPFVHISSNNECEKENGTQKFRHHLLSAGHLKNLRCLQKDESPLFTRVVFSSNIVYFYCR